MLDIFHRRASPRLSGSLVWLPMLAADDLPAALAREAELRDGRVSHYWDGRRALGRLAARSLNLSAPTAWDIYLLYPPGVSWAQEALPAPLFWMHQLDERPDLLLDPARLDEAVRQALSLIDPLENER